MKRYKIDIEITYAGGIYDGDEYHELRVRESENGDWIKASDIKELTEKSEKLESKIKRMQAYIDKLEGRA